MYLVHAFLRCPDSPPPADLAAFVSTCARPDDHLVHAVLHRDAAPWPVLGLYLTAPSLADAELTARALVEGALKLHPAMVEDALVRCEAPLSPPYFEWLARLPDEGGRLMPPPD